MDKIDQFLFDIIGLLIPGFLALLLPLLIYSFLCDSNAVLYFNSSVQYVDSLKSVLSKWIVLLTFLTLVYLLGHVIKILSVRYYNFMQIIFDQNINSFCNIAIIPVTKFLKNITFKNLNPIYQFLLLPVSILIGFLIEIKNIISNFFTFQTEGFYGSSDSAYNKVIEEIKNKFDVDINKKDGIRKLDYFIYKLSTIVQDSENIKTLTHTFLAKYNFYRSLSCIFFLNIIYAFYLIEVNKNSGMQYTSLLLVLVIFEYTFREKYKRYWQLSGNEALLGIYYFLNIKNNHQQKNLWTKIKDHIAKALKECVDKL